MPSPRRRFLAEGASAAAALVLGSRSARAAAPADGPLGYWPQWRRPLSTGEAPSARPPLEWGEGRNVRFKVSLPGDGKGTPIVWRDLILVTAAVPVDGTAGAHGGEVPVLLDFVVMALSRSDGSVRWRRSVRREKPHEGTHKDGSFAAGSALTDGERIYAFYGSRGLYALDFEGKVL